MFTQQARTTNFTIESEGVMMLEITLTDKPTDSVKPTESTKPTNPVELTNQITSKNVTATIENTASVSSKESNDISSPSTGDNDLDNKMIFIFALSIVGGALIITKRKKQGIQ